MATEQPYRQRTQYLTPPAWELNYLVVRKKTNFRFKMLVLTVYTIDYSVDCQNLTKISSETKQT